MMIALFSPRPELEKALAGLGDSTVSVADVIELADSQPETGWDSLVVDLAADPHHGLTFARRAKEDLGMPILIIADRADDVTTLGDINDFLLAPIDPDELRIRLRRLSAPAIGEDETIHFKDLELNLATYQAATAGVPIDLTFMEYELLKFFVTHPARAWTRAQILSQVWGYEYFGGSRTVDVHVRRLRAKLGEERSSWIATVRSVGYRFG